MMRLMALVLVACCLASGSFAQQQTSAELRQQVEAVAQKWMGSFNSGDAQALAALCAPDCLTVTAFRMAASSEQLEQGVRREVAARTRYTRFSVEVVRAIDADAAVAAGPYSIVIGDGPPIDGTWLQVYSRSGGTWKIVATSLTRRAAVPGSGAAR